VILVRLPNSVHGERKNAITDYVTINYGSKEQLFEL